VPKVRPFSARGFIGLVFVLISLINLAANSCWLRSGDLHRPNHHFGMRGGWTGFWITTVLFSGLLVVGIVLLLAEWRTRRRVARGGFG
jgi:uncharacterized membrane protein